MHEIVCAKCDTDCQVDGEYPKFFAWCWECNDYAEGFDVCDYGADWMGNAIDEAMNYHEG